MKNIFIKSSVLIVVLFLLVTCSKSGEDVAIVKYNLNVIISPENSGTVTPSNGSFEEGSTINITGIPSSDYTFKEWKGDVTGTTNPMTVTMNSNKIITVVFEGKDVDGDGVMDSVDTCSDTPSGETVDSNGCSTSQKDTDGDGVMDSVDTCSDTPSGETVDSNGCSESQLYTSIPDSNFEKALYDENIGYQMDNRILTSYIKNIKVLHINNRGIKDLTGIEGFTSLEMLYITGNEISELDLSNNPNLIYLNVQNNNLSSLNISENTLLTYLYCNGNQLTSLDLSNNSELIDLYVDDNKIKNLEVSNKHQLFWLGCYNNELTSLVIENNPKLINIVCYGNKLTDLDVSSNASLEYLYTPDNELKNINVSGLNFLGSLDCQRNLLTSLDVSTNNSLDNLVCLDNNINCIQVSQTQINSIPIDWYKDIGSSYSLNCN